MTDSALQANKRAIYPVYKPSGVEWLGDVPAHWEPIRLRYRARINPSRSELNGTPGNLDVSFVPMEAVHEYGGLTLDQMRPFAEVATGYTYFRDGDVLAAKITPCFENGKGSVADVLVNSIGFGTTELHVLRPCPELNRRFLFYVTISHAFRHLGAAEMYGAGGQKRVPDDFIRDFRLPIPSTAEQQVIAAFLDRETARIDALIEKKRRQIELLKEKRSALISHAVTKGLAPAAPMKDSGIEWLGQIPAHWELRRLKFLLDAMIDTEHKTVPFYQDGEYLVVRTSNVRNGRLVLDGAKYTDVDGYREWTRRGRPRPGDILFTREAPAGEACRVPSGYLCCIGQRMVLFRVRQDRLNDRFGVYSIYSGLASVFIRLLSQGSTVAHFNMRDIGCIPMLVPSVDEQKQIADWLDHECERISTLVGAVESSIEKLKELRTALISAAVTGKIDVRGEVE